MAKHINIIHLSAVPVEQMKVPDGSAFGGSRQRVGAAIGAKKLGYSFFAVPPGKAAFPFHLHHTNEEMIYIFEGEGILRLGKDEVQVSGGTFIAFPPGADHPHQLINTSNRDLRYLCVSTMEYPEIAEYPDSDKIGTYVTGASDGGFRALYRKEANVSYYDGESSGEIERIKKSSN
ncbi:MAG: cupin domain-containing protein [Deltaproteobacteria bacterium]|nr:MAG: cupin domain-containing protein [Deltaproteobacteria bacterium]